MAHCGVSRAPALALAFAALFGGGGMLTGCEGRNGGAASAPAPPSAVSAALSRRAPVARGLVDANNAFGFDVFGQLVRTSPTKNVFVSPVGIALALEIVANGAKGDTLAGMAKTLRLAGMDVADVNTANAALQASLVSADPQCQINIANSLWLHRDRAQVRPAFVTINTTYYGSEIGDLADAPDAINAWASRHTMGKITSIVANDDYKSMAAVVVNAVYFKGKWTMPFDPVHTSPAPFTRLDGSPVTAPMMNQSGTIGYYKGAGFQAARLRYGSGRLSLIVALPNKGADWKTFLAGLSPHAVDRWAAGFKKVSVAIGLPRFQSEYAIDLKAPLSALGMALAFDPGRADLTGIAPPDAGNIYLEYVKHKTFLKVDEEGTEAAAVTAASEMAAAIQITDFQMTLDHPFFCAIRDDTTGELLFMGCIVDPTASGS